jgi:hypothetical protein
MAKIIGLTGKKRSGKDTSATMLIDIVNDHYYDVIVLSFAEPLKKAVSILFNLEITESNKEIKNENWNASPRQLLQLTGDKMRELYPDIFIKNVHIQIEKYLNDKNYCIIVTDIRYNQEAELIKSLGGKIIKLERTINNNNNNDTHSSEQDIKDEYLDYVIYNDYGLRELEIELERIMEELNFCNN